MSDRQPDNVAALCQGIWQLEQDYGLLDLELTSSMERRVLRTPPADR